MAKTLPLEIVTHILSFLDLPDREEASLVCKKWYHASLDPRFHKNTVLTLKASTSSSSHLPGLGYRKTPHLVVSYIDGSVGSSWVIDEMGRHLGFHLSSLSLRGCDINEKMFIKVIGHCVNLTSLDLGCCNTLFMSGNLLKNENDKLAVSTALVNVRELFLNSIRYLSDVLFNRLVSTMPNLERLSFAGCNIAFEIDPHTRENNKADSMTFLTFSNLVKYFMEQATVLKHLNFSHTAITNKAVESLAMIKDLDLTELILQNCLSLTHKGVESLAEHNPELKMEVLELTECRSVDALGLQSAFESFANLKKLKLSGLRTMPSKFLEDFFTQLPKLEQLAISSLNLSTEGLCKGLSGRCLDNLRNLDLAGCVSVDDNVVSALSSATPNLQALNLKSCQALSDAGVHIIIKSFPNLKKLNLAWCMHITDFGLLGIDKDSLLLFARSKESDKYHSGRYTRSHSNMGFFTIPNFEEKIQKVSLEDYQVDDKDKNSQGLEGLTKLEYLDLSNCSHITDVGIESCIRFAKLKHLNVSFCRNLTDKSVASVSNFNLNLVSLNLSQCHQVTDLGVGLIASKLRHLRLLNLKGCVKVSDKTFPAFAQNCRRLKFLNLSQCGMVSLGALKRLSRELPALHKVEVGHTGSSFDSLYQPDFF